MRTRAWRRGLAASFLSLGLGAGLPAWASGAESLEAEARDLHSRLTRLTHTFTRLAEWESALKAVDDLVGRAEQAGETDVALWMRMAEARTRASWREGLDPGIAVLEEARIRFAGASPDLRRRALIEQARLYARAGRVEAIRDLLEAYRAGPLSPPEAAVDFRGGQGARVPLEVMRPAADRLASASLVETALKEALREARLGPGQPAPLFRAPAVGGGVIDLHALRGRPVLLEFWRPGADAPESPPVWRRLREQTAPLGLTVLGVPLGPSPLQPGQIPAWFDGCLQAPSRVSVDYGFPGITGRVLISAQGILLRRNPPLHDIRQTLTHRARGPELPPLAPAAR